jgi:hypothetical protein
MVSRVMIAGRAFFQQIWAGNILRAKGDMAGNPH